MIETVLGEVLLLLSLEERLSIDFDHNPWDHAYARKAIRQDTSSATMKLDSAVAAVLKVDLAKTTVSPAGGGGCSSASTAKITTSLPDGKEIKYFMKTGKRKNAEVMFEGTLCCVE